MSIAEGLNEENAALRALVGRMKTAGSAMIDAWDDGTGTCKQDDAVSLMQQAIEDANKVVN